MLFDPMTDRTNFWARKLVSLEALEQLNIPNPRDPSLSITFWNPAAARSSASSQVAGLSCPPSRTSGSVRRGLGALPPDGLACGAPGGCRSRSWSLHLSGRDRLPDQRNRAGQGSALPATHCGHGTAQS